MEYFTSPLVSTHPQDHSYSTMMSCIQNLDLGYGVCGHDRESSSRDSVFGASKYSCFSAKPLFVGESSAVQGPQVLDQTTWAGQSNGEPIHAPVPCAPRSSVHTNTFSHQEQVRSHGACMPNPQDVVSVAMRNEGLMFLQNAVVVELVLCMRVMNEILHRAVPRDHDQQTPNRIQDLVVPTHSKRIFVGGLASTVTESDFTAYFYQFGTITNVKVMYDHFTRRPRGFGFITFDSEEAVDKVLHRTSFHELNGKIAEVKRAIPKGIYRKSIRGQLAGLKYGLSNVSNLLNACTQGYNPGQAGGSGLKVDGRFSPAAISCSGYPSFSHHGDIF